MKSVNGQPNAAIRVARRFSAPAKRVFDAWLDPGSARHWLFATASRPLAHVDIDARVTGSFRFVERHPGAVIEHIGSYIEIRPHRALVFSLSVENHPHALTRVAVEITALKTGCALALIHEDVPRDWARHTRARWIGILYGLAATLDSTSERADSRRRAFGVGNAFIPLRSNP